MAAFPSHAPSARIGALLAALATLPLAGTVLAAATGDPAPATAEAGTRALWRPQTLHFSYSGMTTRYSCDGIEAKVRLVLETFGARHDMKVRATGCDLGMERIGPFATVTAEFNALVPATDPADAAAVDARWAPLLLAPDRPLVMGQGDCELVEQMRDALGKSFTLRNTDYHATCIPHQLSPQSYAVRGEVLLPKKP